MEQVSTFKTEHTACKIPAIPEPTISYTKNRNISYVANGTYRTFVVSFLFGLVDQGMLNVMPIHNLGVVNEGKKD